MAGIVYISPSGGGISKIKEGTKTTLSGVIIGDGTTISSVASDYYIQTTGIIAFTGIQSYNTHKLFTEDTQIVDKKYIDDTIHSRIDEISGSVVELDTSNFDGILSDKDTQVQHAFDTIDDITTTNIPEGINLYYTDSRARLSIGETIPGISYNSGTGIFSLEPDYVIPRTTSDIPEGSNLYHTDARSRSSISETITGILYNSGTGVFSLEEGYIIPKTTTDIPEGNNLYYTNSRARSAINEVISGISYDPETGIFSLEENYIIPRTTSDIPEGINKYYTDSRSRSAISETIIGISYNSGTGVFSLDEGYVIPQTTSDIPEGTNLYYTDARVRAAISITSNGLNYNSDTGVLSVSSGYIIPTTTDELNWNEAYSKEHDQNTDIGTTSTIFILGSNESSPIKLKNELGTLRLRNNNDSDDANLVIGNLTVNGTQTVIHSTVLEVDDNTITVNAGTSGTPVLDGGLIVDRGDFTNASILWNESSDKWIAGLLGSEAIIWTENTDGEGSGLDADLLDGRHASYFAVSGHVHSQLSSLDADDHTQYIRTDGLRSFTGVISYDSPKTFNSNLQIIDKKYVDDSIISLSGSAISYTNQQLEILSGSVISYTNQQIETLSGFVNTNYVKTNEYKDIDVLNKIKNVDGVDSGLDADLLDGQHASYFASQFNLDILSGTVDNTTVKLTGNQTISGIKTFNNFLITPSSLPNSDYEVANKKYVDEQIATKDNHEELEGLLGGSIDEHYHLTSGQLYELTSGVSTDLHSHEIYILADGTRSFTGVVQYDSHPSFSVDTELVDKKYVDDKIENFTSDHEKLEGLLGGDINSHWHLTSGQHNELISGNITNLHSHIVYPSLINSTNEAISGQILACESDNEFKWVDVSIPISTAYDSSFILTSEMLQEDNTFSIILVSGSPESKSGTLVTLNGVDLPKENWDLYGANLIISSGCASIGDYVHVFNPVNTIVVDGWLTPETYPLNPYDYYTIINSGQVNPDQTINIELDFSPQSKENLLIFKNNYVLNPETYSVDGEIITLVSGVADVGNTIQVKNISTAVAITQVELDSITSPFSIYHDGTDGHIVCESGDLYIDTINPTGGITSGCIRSHGKIYNAVWNDFADHWHLAPNEKHIPGLCYCDYGSGLELPRRKSDPSCIGICSDTFGISVGDKPNTIPIGVAGFLLAYVDKQYKSGTLLINNKDGSLTKARWWDILLKRVVAKYIRKEQEETFNSIPVNGRHWVKII